MIVYFVTQKDMGEIILLKPKIPKSASKEEGIIKRICVSTSILGALSSIGRNLYLGCVTYIYKADIEIKDIFQPNDFVDDIDCTGELWLMKNTEFILHKKIKLLEIESFLLDSDKEIYNYKFESLGNSYD